MKRVILIFALMWCMVYFYPRQTNNIVQAIGEIMENITNHVSKEIHRL